jgi:hypothetical protein
MARHGQPLGANNESALYEQAEACRLSQLDPAIVEMCVNRQFVSPVRKDGKLYFTGPDILKLKLLRTLLLSRQLSSTLDQAFLKVGRDLLEQPATTTGGNGILDQVLDDLMQRLKRA